MYLLSAPSAMTSTEEAPLGGGRSILDDMVGVGDMVLIEPLTEDAVMENLWERYNSKDIYVSTVLRINYK